MFCFVAAISFLRSERLSLAALTLLSLRASVPIIYYILLKLFFYIFIFRGILFFKLLLRVGGWLV